MDSHLKDQSTDHMLKASIVIAVLNSHEIVRRQIEWFKKMPLPDDVELIIVDDGSDPPLRFVGCAIYPTNDFRPWTQPLARNMGARLAHGEYIICTDIDHIITRDLIETVRNTTYDVVKFRRELGVLTEESKFTQDHAELVKYGIPEERTKMRLPAHGNSYAIKRELFLNLGGSQQKEKYPNQDELPLKHKIKKLRAAGEITVIPDEERPVIYMIPNGRFCGDKDYNPFNLFHNLSRKRA